MLGTFSILWENWDTLCPCFSSLLPRYSIERVFRPRKPDRMHPRELMECAFDIITPVTNSLLPDAETIYTISEIVQEFPALQVIRMYCLYFKWSSELTACAVLPHLDSHSGRNVCWIIIVLYFPTDAFISTCPVVFFSMLLPSHILNIPKYCMCKPDRSTRYLLFT